ncbi:hypothetical protein FGRMN_3318 [Fusarium graminum]|nr:hypothetical protein FGRMN_3318 [Fusarium graminum]
MFKQRSHDTHYNTHLPLITGNPGQCTNTLLESSVLERFKTTGLIKALKEHQQIKLIYVHMGGNNMNKSGLRKQDVEAYGKLIKGLRSELPEATIVTTALFVQHGLDIRVIDEANNGLREITDANDCKFLPFGDQRGMIKRDKVHPNTAEYIKWNEILENDMKGQYE